MHALIFHTQFYVRPSPGSSPASTTRRRAPCPRPAPCNKYRLLYYMISSYVILYYTILYVYHIILMFYYKNHGHVSGAEWRPAAGVPAAVFQLEDSGDFDRESGQTLNQYMVPRGLEHKFEEYISSKIETIIFSTQRLSTKTAVACSNCFSNRYY